jgi:hypothetical protein
MLDIPSSGNCESGGIAMDLGVCVCACACVVCAYSACQVRVCVRAGMLWFINMRDSQSLSPLSCESPCPFVDRTPRWRVYIQQPRDNIAFQWSVCVCACVCVYVCACKSACVVPSPFPFTVLSGLLFSCLCVRCNSSSVNCLPLIQ